MLTHGSATTYPITGLAGACRVLDDMLKSHGRLQHHGLLTGNHLLVNSIVEMGHLQPSVKHIPPGKYHLISNIPFNFKYTYIIIERVHKPFLVIDLITNY